MMRSSVLGSCLFGALVGLMAVGCSGSSTGSTAAATAAASSSSSNTGGKGSAGSAGSMGSTGGSAGSANTSNTSGPTSGSGGAASTSGSGSTGSTASSLCPSPSLQIYFSPMFSASIPGSTAHTFSVPAIVNGVDLTTVSWAASPAGSVSLAPDPVSGGEMITTNAPGTVTIEAYITKSPTVCGSSILTITSNAESDWETGNSRYNLVDGGNAGSALHGGNNYIACTNCHGPTATQGPLQTIAHTPEQTGGFSDTDLGQIIEHGTVPDGGYFDSSIISYQAWQSFHQWSMPGNDLPGVICYLRSLTPTPQTGTSNFGGHYGDYDGGFHHHGDGGNFHGGFGGICSPCTDNSQCGGGTCITDSMGGFYCAPICSTYDDPDSGIGCQSGTCFGLSNGIGGCYPAGGTCVGYDAGM